MDKQITGEMIKDAASWSAYWKAGGAIVFVAILWVLLVLSVMKIGGAFDNFPR